MLEVVLFAGEGVGDVGVVVLVLGWPSSVLFRATSISLRLTTR